MMPYPVNIGQCEQARNYFVSAHHVDHHIAMENARMETCAENEEQLHNSVWEELSMADKRRLINAMVHTWRKKAGVSFEEFRTVDAIDECFNTQIVATTRAKTWSEIKKQLDAGVAAMFARSNSNEVHADLYARTGGCLCWGTWSLIVNPAAYEQFSKNVFPFLRPFGADCHVSELVVQIACRIVRVRETLTKGEITSVFPEYVRWGELAEKGNTSTRWSVFIMQPFTYKEVAIAGLVWRNPSSCSRVMSVADELARLRGCRREDVPERPRTTYSDVPIKLRSTLEKSGCEVGMDQLVRICGESAVVEHLRRECHRLKRPDIHGDLLIRRDANGNVTNAVEGKVVWSESGRNTTVGHWGVAVEHPTRPGEVLFLSTNIHMAISPEMKLLGEDVLRIGSSESHLAKVLLGYIQRTNVEIHGTANVFIGSKWSHKERETQLPRLAENGIAVIQLIREEFPLLTDIKSREIETLEYFTKNQRRGDQWLDNARKRIEAVKTNMKEDTRWSCVDLTVDGTRTRMYAADQRTTGRVAHRAATGQPMLGLNFGCNLIFHGDAFAFQGVPDRAVIAAVETGVNLTANSTFDVNDDEFSDLDEEQSDEDDEEQSDEDDETTTVRPQKRQRSERH